MNADNTLRGVRRDGPEYREGHAEAQRAFLTGQAVRIGQAVRVGQAVRERRHGRDPGGQSIVITP